MRHTIPAIYENGVFRPLKHLPDLRDQDQVDLLVMKENHPLSDCIGILADDDAAEMKLVIEREFEQVNPDDWK